MDDLESYWPCCLCFSYGYLFSICTLGFSFCFPNLCISEAKKHFLKNIHQLNDEILNRKGLMLNYREKCSTSWLEIELLEKSYSLENNSDLETESNNKANSRSELKNNLISNNQLYLFL